MKTALVSSMFALSVVSLSVSAEEFSWGDMSFQPRAYIGYANYSLESGSFDSIYTFSNGQVLRRGQLPLDLSLNNKIKIRGLLWGIGGTVVSGQFFGDFYYQSTLDDDGSDTEKQLTDSDIVYNKYLGDVDVQHADWAFSLGYMITDQWSLFAGYKSGDTEWDQSSRAFSLSSQIGLIGTYHVNGEFQQDGPFVGASYSFPIGSGVLNFKAAYAYLSGDYQTNYSEVEYPPLGGISDKRQEFDQINLDGDSNAFSVGVSWTQSLANDLGYSIGVNYHHYEFDLSGASSRVGSSTINYRADYKNGTMTEELFTLTASLIYTFQQNSIDSGIAS